MVRFLMTSADFPRSVQGCFDAIRSVLHELPSPAEVVVALDHAESALRLADPHATGGAEIDRAMDQVQVAIAALHGAIHRRYVDVAS